MPPFYRELTVSGCIPDLPDILAFVQTACTEAGVDPARLFDLQLAVEEACANVIEHAYNGLGGELTVVFEVRGRNVTITVRDHGQPFAPEDVVAPDMCLPLEQRRIGGLGLHLMYQLMDEVHFDFGEDLNTLVMVKRDALSDLQPGVAL